MNHEVLEKHEPIRTIRAPLFHLTTCGMDVAAYRCAFRYFAGEKESIEIETLEAKMYNR